MVSGTSDSGGRRRHPPAAVRSGPSARSRSGSIPKAVGSIGLEPLAGGGPRRGGVRRPRRRARPGAHGGAHGGAEDQRGGARPYDRHGNGRRPHRAPRGRVYFSNPTGGGVYRWCPGGPAEVIVPKRQGAGGIAAHVDGGVVISGRDLSRVVDAGSTTLVAREDIPTPAGLRAIGFNDIVADRWGNVLAGCHLGMATTASPTWSSCLVYVVPGEDPVIAYGDLHFTNGIGHDADAEWLYHSDTHPEDVIVARLADGPPARASGLLDAKHRPPRRPGGRRGRTRVGGDGPGWWHRPVPTGRHARHLARAPHRKPLSLCFVGERRRRHVRHDDGRRNRQRPPVGYGTSMCRTGARRSGWPGSDGRTCRDREGHASRADLARSRASTGQPLGELFLPPTLRPARRRRRTRPANPGGRGDDGIGRRPPCGGRRPRRPCALGPLSSSRRSPTRPTKRPDGDAGGGEPDGVAAYSGVTSVSSR